MKKKYRLKPKIKNILLVFLIIIFVFSVMKITIFSKDLKENEHNIKKLNDEVIDITIEDDREKIKIDFDKLLSINDDTVGWIRFNSDKVNNPIVHTSDNSYYLNRSFEKKSNQSGTIFMDYRNKSFDDKNVVLFGHSMLDKTIFGSLSDVFKKDFFNTKENNYIQIINTDNEILTYQIFSYYIIEKEEYYITTSFNSDSEFKKFIDTIKKRSYKNFKIDVTTSDKILTLSTCSGTGETSKREVIHAKRVENKE